MRFSLGISTLIGLIREYRMTRQIRKAIKILDKREASGEIKTMTAKEYKIDWADD